MAPPARPPHVEEDMEEGTGESFPPPRSPRAFNPDLHEVHRKICLRLRQTGRHNRTLADPTFNKRLACHLERMPRRYLVDLDLDDKVDDVLLHWRILDECIDPDKRPVFYARFLKYKTVPREDEGVDHNQDNQDHEEPCQKLLEELSLERRKTVDRNDSMSISSRGELKTVHLHEIIFSSMDKPKLLSRLTALLSEVGLNIQEAHVYSTMDGFCLDVFVVDGWMAEETDQLIATIKETLTQKNASPSDSTNSWTSEKIVDLLAEREAERQRLQALEAQQEGLLKFVQQLGEKQGWEIPLELLAPPPPHRADSTRRQSGAASNQFEGSPPSHASPSPPGPLPGSQVGPSRPSQSP